MLAEIHLKFCWNHEQHFLLQDTRSTAEVRPPVQVMNDLQSNRQNQLADEAPGTDSSSIPAATSDNRKVSREDIELVR